MILGTGSDGEYGTEITTEARKGHEPTDNRLRSARVLAGGIGQLCEADLECRRLAPAWKLVNIFLNNALSFDCCVVPPEATASYAQELGEIFEALFPFFVGQDRLEPLTIKRMRLPRNAGGFDVMLACLQSPTAFLAQYLAIAPSVAKAAGERAESSKRPGMRREGQGSQAYRWTKEECRGKVTSQIERWTLPEWETKP